MKSVKILGSGGNIYMLPSPSEMEEVWACNHNKGYKRYIPRVIENQEWTRWFNLHSREHMVKTYLKAYKYFYDQTKPIYFQIPQPDVPSSVAFPYKDVLKFFNGNRYFTCTAAWMLAFAIYEGFERIELWGIHVAKRDPDRNWERPCLFFWINEARRRGIDVWWPTEGTTDWDLSEAGDPLAYTGKLYGYGTKPEPGWNNAADDWD
jgi:hypothetical protein